MRVFVGYYFDLVGSSAYDNYLSGMGCYFGLVGMSLSAYDNYLSDKDSSDKDSSDKDSSDKDSSGTNSFATDKALIGKNFVALSGTNSSVTYKESVEYPLSNH